MNGWSIPLIAAGSSIVGALVGVGIWAGVAGNELENHKRRIIAIEVRAEVLSDALTDQRISLAEIKRDVRAILNVIRQPLP